MGRLQEAVKDAAERLGPLTPGKALLAVTGYRVTKRALEFGALSPEAVEAAVATVAGLVVLAAVNALSDEREGG